MGPPPPFLMGPPPGGFPPRPLMPRFDNGPMQRGPGAPPYHNSLASEEDAVLGERYTTLFVGTIHQDVADEVIFRLLQVRRLASGF